MVQKPVLNNVKKGTGQREVKPVWTNAMRVNHQKFFNSRRNFAPTAVLTKSGIVLFSTARQNFSRTAAPVSAARPFNITVHKPFVNVAKPRTNACQKKRMTSAVGEQRINAVKPIAYWAWRPKIKVETKDYTVESGEDSLKLIELIDLCIKLIDNVTILENASKETHAQTLTMLMKKVKRLEDKLKFYNTRKKARIVILDTKEYLISEDSIKQERMEETDDS
ncbi:hypothetical protein Tco_1097916 [Tanacetum coccineum]